VTLAGAQDHVTDHGVNTQGLEFEGQGVALQAG